MELKIISISELINQSLPLTGASSLIPLSPQPPKPNKSSQHPSPPPPSSSSPFFFQTPSLLPCLNHPTLLSGTLNHHSPTCPTSSFGCFSFSDTSATVCCSILSLHDDAKLFGKQIHVLSWNFIPFTKCTTGFLEIITWTLPPASNALRPCSHEFQLPEETRLVGKVDSVSPVSVVPCTSKKDEQNSTAITGFLSLLLICKCELCSLKGFVRGGGENATFHRFTEAVIVYFIGSSLSWHSLVSKVVGKVVCITGLKKKMVFIGKQDSRCMFTTTDRATFRILKVHLSLPFPRNLICGEGGCGAYTGVVTGVYMQGMVVELDRKVCLLLADRMLAPSHFVRIGAMVSLKNVHFVRPKFAWTTTLLLGACCKTTINVESFSPLESRCHIRSQTQSLLGKFVESLVFSARFWLLLTITSFKKKFASFFSEKQILGSKHKEGLAQMYAKSCLPTCVFRPRHGVLTEFCNHDLYGCGNEPNYNHPKLAVPISTFISHCEVLWLTMLLEMKNDCKITGESRPLSCEGKSNSRCLRRIISGEDLGVALMGVLQVSSSSRRLQLVDSSGSIDVVIPDMPSNCNADNVYEVRYYNIVIEGLPAEVDAASLCLSESFSFRGVFQHEQLDRETKPSAIYVHFYMRDVSCLNFCLHLPSSNLNDNLMDTKDGLFHLLLVTHKFPAIHDFQGDQTISNTSSFLAECMILPWDLFLPIKDGDTCMTGLSKEALKEHSEYSHRKNILENVCQKRVKLAHGSNRVSISASEDNLGESGHVSRSRKFNNLSSLHEFPCLVIVKNLNTQRQARPGSLLSGGYHVIDGVVGRPSYKRVLLEFKPETLANYELLRLGRYYVMEHAMEDLSYSRKDRHHVTGGKACVNSQTPLWSVSFSCEKVLAPTDPTDLVQDPFLQTTSISNHKVPSECSHTSELFFQQYPSQSLETCSLDVNLYLSIDAMKLLKVTMNSLEDELIKPTLSRVVGNSSIVMDASLHSPAIVDPDCRLPHGSLVSLHGHVVDIHSFHCYLDVRRPVNSEGVAEIHCLKIFHDIPSSICIHISGDQGIVRLHGTLSKYGYPIGLGPGSSATFHRVLIIGQHEFLLTPVSFIVVNSIKEVVQDGGERCSLPEFGWGILNDQDIVSSSLISEVLLCTESKLLRFCCRVVAIHVLVLEKQNNEFKNIHSRVQSEALPVHIPLAGFILDDGSSSCCCWASAERATTLLRLHEETVSSAYYRNSWRVKRGRRDKAQRSTYWHLGRILKKHRRITVKNYGSMSDSSCQDLLFSVDSDNVFSCSDENLLKLIITNACCSSVLSVVGSIMDSNATAQLQKDLSELHIRMESMKNIWAKEVHPVNHLAEARSLIQELI